MEGKHYSKFSSLLLMVEIHKNTDMHVQPLSFEFYQVRGVMSTAL